MNRILFFTALQTLFGAALLVFFKMQGYTMAAVFAQPSQYFSFILPISIIFGVFSFLITVFFSPKTKVELAFKVVSIILIIFTTIYNATASWIYITCGSNLQILVTSFAFAMYVAVFALFLICKHIQRKSK